MSSLVSSVMCRYVVPLVKLYLLRLRFSVVVGRVGGLSASQEVFAIACSSGCPSLPSHLGLFGAHRLPFLLSSSLPRVVFSLVSLVLRRLWAICTLGVCCLLSFVLGYLYP